MSSSKDDRMAMALKEAFAGVGGSIWSSTLIYPMDFLKTRMQVPGAKYTGMTDAFSQVVKEEGFLSLYTGLSSEVLKSAVQHFVYFYVYAFLKDFAQTKTYKQYGSALGLCECDDGPVNLFSPATSRKGSEAALPYPTVKRSSSNPLDSVHDMSELMPMCCGACLKPVHISHSALEITAPDTPKRQYSTDNGNNTTPRTRSNKPSTPPQLGMGTNLLVGIIAGCATQLFVTPLSVVQTRVMTAKKQPGAKHLGIFAMLLHIAATEGISSLFAGLIPSLVLTSNPAIQFVVFDRVKLFVQDLLKRWQKSHQGMTITLPAAYSFIIGAFAKIVATVCTYPYIMAKVRLQYKSSDNNAPIYTGTINVIASILKEEGFFGLYTGLRAQMLKSVLGAALMFMGKEKLMIYSQKVVELLLAKKSYKNV